MKLGRYELRQRQDTDIMKMWDVLTTDKWGGENRLYTLTVSIRPEYDNKWLWSLYSVNKHENIEADKVPSTLASFAHSIWQQQTN